MAAKRALFQEPAEPASGMTSSSAAAVDVDPAQGFMRLPTGFGRRIQLECGEEILIGCCGLALSEPHESE